MVTVHYMTTNTKLIKTFSILQPARMILVRKWNKWKIAGTIYTPLNGSFLTMSCNFQNWLFERKSWYHLHPFKKVHFWHVLTMSCNFQNCFFRGKKMKSSMSPLQKFVFDLFWPCPTLFEIRLFRIISIPSKFCYFRRPDHVISMELLALNFRCQCT